MDKYINLSIELHLFFGRIMKEHSLFLKAGFPSKEKTLIDEAEWYKKQFENLLLNVVSKANELVNSSVLSSGELFTEYTLAAEKMTENLSGIDINTSITELENNLQSRASYLVENITSNEVQRINNYALNLVNGLIHFKERLLANIGTCNLFTTNYPMLIEHILREAKLYRAYIMELEQNHDIISESLRDTELFWNQIMMEHALFIRGLLDPSEENLIDTADNFAKEYKDLLAESSNKIQNMTKMSLNETLKYKEFKAAGTKGLLECKIKSIILPLLADHVLREANHFIRILNEK